MPVYPILSLVVNTVVLLFEPVLWIKIGLVFAEHFLSNQESSCPEQYFSKDEINCSDRNNNLFVYPEKRYDQQGCKEQD